MNKIQKSLSRTVPWSQRFCPRMNQLLQICVSTLVTGVVLAVWQPALLASEAKLYLRCQPDNDLYRVLVENKVPCSRFDTPEQAVREAPEGAGVLVLAD